MKQKINGNKGSYYDSSVSYYHNKQSKLSLKHKLAIAIPAITTTIATLALVLFPTANQLASALTINSLSQISGPLTGGNEITIKGSGFMTNGEKIKQLAAGGLHSLALTDTGKLYAWGLSSYGGACTPT